MRASLLLNCSVREAREVRKRAKLQGRTVSGYVVRIVMRSVSLSEEMEKSYKSLPGDWKRYLKKQEHFRPRTTLHVYCSGEQAERIRRTARAQGMSISGLVLRCLRRSWLAEDAVDRLHRPD